VRDADVEALDAPRPGAGRRVEAVQGLRAAGDDDLVVDVAGIPGELRFERVRARALHDQVDPVTGNVHPEISQAA
jgi:hypothetical protein